MQKDPNGFVWLAKSQIFAGDRNMIGQQALKVELVKAKVYIFWHICEEGLCC